MAKDMYVFNKKGLAGQQKLFWETGGLLNHRNDRLVNVASKEEIQDPVGDLTGQVDGWAK